MVRTFRKHRVMAGRSPKARLTSGNGCFADQSFAFVKVSFLLADVHDNAWLSGNAFVVPSACGSGARIEARLIWCWVLFATGNNQRREQRACNGQYSAVIQKAADTIQWEFAHSTVKSLLPQLAAASEKRRLSSRRTRLTRHHQARAVSSILPSMTQFDALHA